MTSPAAARRILSLPGWQDSGPDHWQTRWQHAHGHHKVEQSDWAVPRRGDWMARLDGVLRDEPAPVLLVAHSLGCHLVAAWAARSAVTARVHAALLVAPPDLEAPQLPEPLHGWRPSVRQRLPFPATVVFSRDDPFAAADATQALAQHWGAEGVDLGARGHINAESGLGDWPQGLALLQALDAQAAAAAARPPAPAPG